MFGRFLAPLARLERAAHGLGIRCSIHLSYRGTIATIHSYSAFFNDKFWCSPSFLPEVQFFLNAPWCIFKVKDLISTPEGKAD